MGTHNVVFTDAARRDLIDIYTYVATNDSIPNADKLLAALKKACYGLSQLPLRGHIPHEFELFSISDYLEIHCKEYRIIYEFVNKAVYIYCIIHTKRDVADLLTQRLLR